MENGVNGMAGSPPGSVVGTISPDDPRPGETWRHYKGRDYEIVAVGLFEADRTPMVVYRCPKSGQGWVRTLANFTEPVTVDGIAGRPVPYRRFSRVGRPRESFLPEVITDELQAARGRVNGKTDIDGHVGFGLDAAGNDPSDHGEQDEAYRASVDLAREAGPHVLGDVALLLQRAGFHVDVDRSIYDCVEELIGRVRANEAVSQHGKPPVPGSLARMREAWMALQLVIARLETAACYSSTPTSVIGSILNAADDVKLHLDAAMGDVEDAAGIAPDEAPG